MILITFRIAGDSEDIYRHWMFTEYLNNIQSYIEMLIEQYPNTEDIRIQISTE